jgi:hypothetical protein
MEFECKLAKKMTFMDPIHPPTEPKVIFPAQWHGRAATPDPELLTVTNSVEEKVTFIGSPALSMMPNAEVPKTPGLASDSTQEVLLAQAIATKSSSDASSVDWPQISVIESAGEPKCSATSRRTGAVGRWSAVR